MQIYNIIGANINKNTNGQTGATAQAKSVVRLRNAAGGGGITNTVQLDKKELIMQSLNSMANTNKVSFSGDKYEGFEIGLSTEELEKRTHKDYLTEKKMLEVDAPEFKNLAEGDQKALGHLVKAAKILEEVNLKQDHEHNIAFREFLQKKAKAGDKDAKMALKLFTAQKGLLAVDTEAQKFSLKKGETETLGKGFYPSYMEPAEFHNILIKMLNDGKKEEVKEILNQHSMVQRSGDELKAIDYTKIFEKEFQAAAKELEKAAKVSTNKDFNEYLVLQARALKENNPMLDAYADKKWAELQDTPLEFTITRENYEDELTGTVVEHKELNQLLEKNGITPVEKDMLGIRVGIVNKEGTEKLLEIKKHLPLLAERMPFAEKYKQNISAKSDDVKQTMVDVDLVTVSGDVGAYRGGVTLAENLPNDDKLSLTIGGGRRNVYHRQIRKISDYKKLQERLDATLAPELHKYYNDEADHWFTIGHENGHSLGPNEGTESLGKYKAIIEENKADMISISMLDVLTEKGMYTEQQKKEILTTFAAGEFLKAEPNINQAHRVRSVMQANFFMNNEAIKVDDKGLINVDFDKMIPTARKMLEKIIDVQISKDFEKGEKYVRENFVWNDGMAGIAKKLKEVNKTLNGIVIEPLAEKLLKSIR